MDPIGEGAIMKNIVISGGAGFIGSSLAEVLLKKGHRVTVIDNLSTGKKENLQPFLSSNKFNFIQLDLLEIGRLLDVLKEFDMIFHLAANRDVRAGLVDTEIDFVNNIVATRNVLECMRKNAKCKKIIFTSSSVVYGEPSKIPTPEYYGPLKPISLYGASKLACEALISAYIASFGLSGLIFRIANAVGPNSDHGVVIDFVNKLCTNSKFLDVLGDGTQTKSYLYIDDLIEALLVGLGDFDSSLETFNVGSDDQISVNSIAQIVSRELGLDGINVRYGLGQADGRGWSGDVKDMLLSVDKLKEYGWSANYSSSEAISVTVKNIIKNGNWKIN
jgi:UDP-glucose 4-epimerase